MVDWLAGNRVRGTSTERTTTTGFNGGFTGVGGWKEVGRTTLGSAGADITVSSLPDKRYYMVLSDITGESSNSDVNCRLNSDSGNNYARRGAYNGTEFTTVNTNFGAWHTTATASTTPMFQTGYFANLSSKEKLWMAHGVREKTAGAGTTPERSEIVSKWTNTSTSLNEISITTGAVPTFNTGSEMVVLGWDETDTHTTNFWEELADVSWTSGSTFATPTFTAKKYLWIQMYKAGDNSTSSQCRLNFNNDTGSNYARRLSLNGGTDTTTTSTDGIHLSPYNTTSDFCNIFMVNNSANEKLITAHVVNAGYAGAGNNTNRVELVGKWANTSSQVTKVHMTSTGDIVSGSTIKVWGSD